MTAIALTLLALLLAYEIKRKVTEFRQGRSKFMGGMQRQAKDMDR